MFQCWTSVFDAGPTLKQHWMNASCLMAVRGWRLLGTISRLSARISTALLCKAKRQYLLTCEVSRYCLLAFHHSSPGPLLRLIGWIFSINLTQIQSHISTNHRYRNYVSHAFRSRSRPVTSIRSRSHHAYAVQPCKAKGSMWLLESQADTAFWLCTAL